MSLHLHGYCYNLGRNFLDVFKNAGYESHVW